MHWMSDVNTIEIDFEMNITTTLNSIADTTVSNGSGWFDATNGMPLKFAATIDTSISEAGMAVPFCRAS